MIVETEFYFPVNFGLYSVNQFNTKRTILFFISAPLSIGRTVLNYRANDALLLSFKNNEEVKILSKGTSDDNEYWGVEVNFAYITL
jgi:hypothetical protein